MTQALQVQWLAQQLGCTLLGDGRHPLVGMLPLDLAGPEHLSFFVDARYRRALAESRAGAVLVGPNDAGWAQRAPQRAWLVCDNPATTAARAAALFAPPPCPQGGVHPSASVAPGAVLGPGCAVGALAVVEDGARLGAGCTIEAQAYVGRDALLGDAVHLRPGARVLHGCSVGARSILHAGAVVGSDGFGYALDGNSGRRVKVPQLGRVEVGCDVELGANATVDRATFGSTVVGDGCKIDNLVMVAHNVQLGRDCVVVAQSGIAGSTQLGARVVVGAQSGFVGHIRVADDVQLAARSGVTKNVTQAGTYGGMPLMPYRAWLRATACLRSLDGLRREMQALRRCGRTMAARREEGP